MAMKLQILFLTPLVVFCTNCAHDDDDCEVYADRFSGNYNGLAKISQNGDVNFKIGPNCEVLISGSMDFHMRAAQVWQDTSGTTIWKPAYVRVSGTIRSGNSASGGALFLKTNRNENSASE